METGIRELKDNLRRYIRRIEAGERIVVTTHRRVVAELVPTASGRGSVVQFCTAVPGPAVRPRCQGCTCLADIESSALVAAVIEGDIAAEASSAPLDSGSRPL